MLDPRIYRTGSIVAVLALVVLAFSLTNQQPALTPTIAPDVFNGQNVYSTMSGIAAADPDRQPASAGDKRLASQVQLAFDKYGFTPQTTTFSGRTVYGTRTLENVVGTRPGVKNGSIVVVASRDALGRPATAAASGTATLIELARDLEGETLNHTMVLASTSGVQGAEGAIQLASTLNGPIDGVIVLGDLASSHVSQPILIPWSANHTVAPTALRNTVGAALVAQTPWSAGGSGLGAQFAHLAFPFTLGQQGPFNAQGIPAVELSLSGEQGPAANAPTDPASVDGMGRTVLETISALDNAPPVSAPSSYLLLSGKVVPGWAVALFVLALMVPVVMTTIDGLARARRRGHVLWRSLLLVVLAGVPFAIAVLVVLAARLLGIMGIAPPGPVAPGAVPLTASGILVMVVALLALGASAAVVVFAGRHLPARVVRRRGPGAAEHVHDGLVAALLVVLCAAMVAIWLGNPFAALLLVPALHLWMWAVSPDMRVPRVLRVALVLVGVAPVAAIVIYYANQFGYGPLASLWEAMLLLAGHGVSLLSTFEWSVVLGCLASAGVLTALVGRTTKGAPPVSVRGPVTYAGPGSLGGTESALRR